MGEVVSVFREEHFNAAHRLNNPLWDAEKNERVFGKCNLPNYHGHNYVLIVKVTGEIDPETGYVMDMKVLSDVISVNVLNRFDHKNLNQDVAEFRQLNPTAENIAIVIYQILRPLIGEHLDLQIRLFETPRNYVDYPVK
ncbi:MAG: 6-pyruvoyl trahydropterin synthase family protein [Chitinophagia bacterium]|jgi:6-pyruvoyltetrahydropterin/6-carboxytetrahydropterin synthase